MILLVALFFKFLCMVCFCNVILQVCMCDLYSVERVYKDGFLQSHDEEGVGKKSVVKNLVAV